MTADFGRERTIWSRAPEKGKPTFVVTRRAAAPDRKPVIRVVAIQF